MSWQGLIGYENDYDIFSEYPYQIRKKLNGKILKESVNSDGYYQVNLNGHPYKKHRIIALQFISNPNNLPCVDHVNHIRTDNRIENLRWVSKSQNQRNQGSYNNVQINYIDYDNCPDDLMMVDKYNQHEFIDYYYSSENNRFYFDTGVNLRELHINFKNNGSAYVHALNTNGKKICIYYSVFKRMHDINF